MCACAGLGLGWRTDRSNDSKKVCDTKPYILLPHMLSSDAHLQLPVPAPSHQALVVASLDPVGRLYWSIMLREGGRRREGGRKVEGGRRVEGERREEGGEREEGRRKESW